MHVHVFDQHGATSKGRRLSEDDGEGAKITVQLHAGTRFYDAHSKLVETSTRAGLAVVALLADPCRAFTRALALQQVGQHLGGTGVASR
jgi:hypothetical protein